jgi:transketolase
MIEKNQRSCSTTQPFAHISILLQIGAVLYSDFMQHNPKDPQWLNRDRFVLSGGHGENWR